ncbi:hypothetical protein CBW46_017285 [Paenibacillus xerothermodurans]|uniref:Uncharacterized protein n=1 Tax=Paenibacillus xerothermodurans TaxID=1977292 RepID=A0A2W1NPN7_PAEXE|nr:hypothetical protein CBW46_017285 [Paenibacillus xerothermodurans]
MHSTGAYFEPHKWVSTEAAPYRDHSGNAASAVFTYVSGAINQHLLFPHALKRIQSTFKLI